MNKPDLRLFFLIVGLAFAPEKAFSDEVHTMSPIHIDSSMTEVNPRGGEVAHHPFALKNPETGKGSERRAVSIHRNKMLTLPDGRKVEAGTYYDELNRFEDYINHYGYSLRQGGDEVIPFGGVKVDQSEIDQKRAETQAKHDPAKIRSRLSDEDAKADHEREASKLSEFQARFASYARPEHFQPKDFHDSKSWSDSWGWSKKFGAYLDTNVSVEGTSERTSSRGNGCAGGYIFGNNLKIVRAEANYSTPKEGKLEGNVSFYFLGYKLYNKDYNEAHPLYLGSGWTKGLDEGTTIHFDLGPIPMSARLGARGDTSLHFRTALLPLNANLDLVPSVHSKVYIQVGASVVVGGAGGGSDLVLLDDQLTVVGKLSIHMDEKGPYYASALSADNEMNTLDGRVYAYVFVYVPHWGIPPWTKKQWVWNLFHLRGITARGSVFNKDEKRHLF